MRDGNFFTCNYYVHYRWVVQWTPGVERNSWITIWSQLVYLKVASYPSLPIFFNVTARKIGKAWLICWHNQTPFGTQLYCSTLSPTQKCTWHQYWTILIRFRYIQLVNTLLVRVSRWHLGCIASPSHPHKDACGVSKRVVLIMQGLDLEHRVHVVAFFQTDDYINWSTRPSRFFLQ